MSNDSTRNGGPLSFADTLSPLERIALGLPQADLSLFEVGKLTFPDKVGKLTFPDNAKFQQSLVETLIRNAKAGNLPVYGNPGGWRPLERRSWRQGESRFENPYPKTDSHESTVRAFFTGRPVRAGEFTFAEQAREWLGDACLVSHADYFAFLKTPLARGIPSPEKWLPPTAESIPVETSLPELPGPARPASIAKGGAAEKEAALLALLDEVDNRAAKQGAGFNRRCLPGTKAEFQKIAIAFNRRAFSVALSTFNGYLSGNCKFQPGVKPEHGKGAAVWALFPEYPLKLG